MTHSHKMMAYMQEMQHISRRAHIWKKTAYIRKVAGKIPLLGERVG